MSLSYKEVAEILKIVDASACEEVILELKNTRLVIRRGAASTVETENIASRPAAKSPAIEQQASQTANASAAKNIETENNAAGFIVKSPMVGLFYRRPSPGEPVFVEEGSRVSAGDTLCLIEVMKLYTRIEATVDGVIDSIMVEDGKLIEFDQPLFAIRLDNE
jgi:acetyl-CoA carboxylase biotin carboxyl carrier protein